MKMDKLKLVSVFSLFIIAIMAISASASALTVNLLDVKVNGNDITSSPEDTLRGNTVDIQVRFKAVGNASNVELHADMYGYEFADRTSLHDSTAVFDVKDGFVYTKTLSIKLPERMNIDVWNLDLSLDDKSGVLSSWNYALGVDTQKHQLTLKDVTFSPETSVQAGRSLITVARVKNTGQSTEEGIKVKVSIPELGISAAGYIDTLDAGETATTEELYMVVPECAKAGEYRALIELTYSDGDVIDTVERQISVIEGSLCEVQKAAEEKTILTIGPDAQSVKAGEKVVYPITISNAGSAAKQYTITAEAGSWAEVSVSPSNVVILEAGEAKAVYVYATANKDASGEQLISVKVASDNQVLKEMTLKANVVGAPAWEKVKKALEVGLVILVILLVIIGLIIGFNRLKGNEDEDKEETQTYY